MSFWDGRVIYYGKKEGRMNLFWSLEWFWKQKLKNCKKVLKFWQDMFD